MDQLQKLNPSTPVAASTFNGTPKRTLLPQYPITPLNVTKDSKDNTSMENKNIFPKNPFDMKTESLYFPACSPSVFATFQRNKVNNGTFRWSIEHLSVLYPADIDENSLPDPWVDADQDLKAQKAIDTFFSQNSIVPSPWSSSPKEGKARRRAHINSVFQDVPKNEATTQTMLSIPPDVDLRGILGNFFTFDDTEAVNSRENSGEEVDLMSTSSLRRKLFAADEDCLSPDKSDSDEFHSAKRWSTPTVRMHSTHSTPASDVLSSSPITPPNCSDSCNILSSPPVSPIRAIDPAEEVQIRSFTDEKEMESVYELANETRPMGTAQESAMNFSFQPNETVAFPSFGSDKLDTGYATGSISLSQNMTSSETNYGLVSRITPVAELMEECELSNSVSCDMSFRNDCSSIGGTSSFQCQKGLPPNTCNFKTYPCWVPTCCSTPAQCSHL